MDLCTNSVILPRGVLCPTDDSACVITFSSVLFIRVWLSFVPKRWDLISLCPQVLSRARHFHSFQSPITLSSLRDSPSEVQRVQLHLLHQCTLVAGAVVQQQHTLVLLHQ